MNKRTDKSDILDIFSSLASPLQELINYKNSPLDTIDDIVNYKRQTKTFWKQEFLTLHASQIDPSFHKNLVNMYLACEKEFNYSLFSSKENKRWSAYQLCKAVAPRICPYCNRNHTPVISNAERDFCRPELDHFIPKSIYPMFAVSFYNLIPSCHSCNHSKQALDVIKKDCFDKFSFKLCHPHVKKDDVTSHSIFTLENTQDVVEQLINYNSSPNITVGLEPNLETKILNSLEAFHLSFNFSNKQQGFYHHHDKEISDSLRLIYHYPKTALNKLNILLYQNSTSENIVSLQNLLIEQIMSTDCKNESLGKLKNDCLKEAVKYW
ncbi:HNH endonuclease [Photobacterium kishitanii]|uniref:HNH endonuclease n=1 Tax=Photobacterium kishitanii TaxID=318456 RepID=UPI00069BB208|nr:hypothetical protein [Photobacterium kishitanii]